MIENEQIGQVVEELPVIAPRVAAVALQRHFRAEARRLRKDDWATQDDLVQEMSLAVLEYPEPRPECFFKDIARKRAIDFLREYEMRLTVPGWAPLAQRFNDVVIEKSPMEEEEEERERKGKQAAARFYGSLFRRSSKTRRVCA